LPIPTRAFFLCLAVFQRQLRPTLLRSIQLISYQELATFCESTQFPAYYYYYYYYHHHHNHHHHHLEILCVIRVILMGILLFRKLLLKFVSLSGPTSVPLTNTQVCTAVPRA
jgi:hypothetical protein